MTDNDPIHNHPTVQNLMRGHRILAIALVVVGVLCGGFLVVTVIDHTVLYSRPAMLQ